MPAAALPHNEAQRLEALKNLHMLDTPIEERFERITRMVCNTLGVPMSAFSMIDTDRQWFKSAQGFTASETSRGLAFCAHAILDDEVLMVPDARKDARFSDNPFVTGDLNINFYAGCPVRAPNGEKIGTLCAIDTRPRDFDESEVQMLVDLAAMVETELRVSSLSALQANLLKELDESQRLALVDPLTRVWNRRGIMQLLERRWSEADRNGDVVVVVMADIDHFKKINDERGHATGDAVLQSVSRRLTAAMREEDVVGRIGGEEFLLILTGCHPSELKRAVERIRSLVAKSTLSVPGGDVNVTLSFGAAAVRPSDAVTIDQLIKFADEALYAAKGAGRNCVEVSAKTAA